MNIKHEENLSVDQLKTKIQQIILDLEQKEELPSRKELLDNFRKTGVLSLCNEWFLTYNKFLTVSRSLSIEYDNLEKYPFQSVIYTHLARMQRYMLGLSRLTWVNPNGKWLMHSIDSYYPILKSVFELSIEFCLALAYRKEFQAEQNCDKNLANRINRYTEFSRKKNNFQFYYSVDEDQREAFWDIMPSDAQEYLRQGKTPAADDLKSMAKEHFHKNHFKDVKHWFPTEDSSGQKIGTKRPGSIQWCCVDVLEKYSDIKEFWKTLYPTTYEMLNRYSHPAMGYDDNFRELPERLFDLARMQTNIITIIGTVIQPKLFEIFGARLASAPVSRDLLLEMQHLQERFLPQFIYFDLAINHYSYKRN